MDDTKLELTQKETFTKYIIINNIIINILLYYKYIILQFNFIFILFIFFIFMWWFFNVFLIFILFLLI